MYRGPKFRRSVLRLFVAALLSCVGLTLAQNTVASDHNLPDRFQTAFEPAFMVILDLEAGYLWREGNALNSSFGPPDENEEFGTIAGHATVVLPVMDYGFLQLDLAAEKSQGDKTFQFCCFTLPTDDSYRESRSATVQGGLVRGRTRVGLYLTNGLYNVFSDDDEDGTYWSAGATVSRIWNWGVITGQAGYLDSDANDEEAIGNAWFGRLAAELNGMTDNLIIRGSISLLDGEQDQDDIPPNELVLVAWEVGAERDIGRIGAQNSVSAYLSYRGSRIMEKSTSGFTDRVDDHLFAGGLRVRLGAENAAKQLRAIAPRLPDFGRWMGSTLAVD